MDGMTTSLFLACGGSPATSATRRLSFWNVSPAPMVSLAHPAAILEQNRSGDILPDGWEWRLGLEGPMRNTSLTGEVGRMQIIAALVLLGKRVLVPLADYLRYDLVI